MSREKIYTYTRYTRILCIHFFSFLDEKKRDNVRVTCIARGVGWWGGGRFSRNFVTHDGLGRKTWTRAHCFRRFKKTISVRSVVHAVQWPCHRETDTHTRSLVRVSSALPFGARARSAKENRTCSRHHRAAETSKTRRLEPSICLTCVATTLTTNSVVRKTFGTWQCYGTSDATGAHPTIGRYERVISNIEYSWRIGRACKLPGLRYNTYHRRSRVFSCQTDKNPFGVKIETKRGGGGSPEKSGHASRVETKHTYAISFTS